MSKNYFHSETLRRITRLDLRAKHVVEGFLSGMHKSRHFGNSVEFRQHRQYVPGDDPKNVDWKVWAKQDRLYVKQYDVDTNLRCTILLDSSPSMQYGAGPWTKYDYACTLAVSLAYLAIRQQDAVACITFDKENGSYLPARMKQSQLAAIVATLEQADPKKTSLKKTEAEKSEPIPFEELLKQIKTVQPDLRDNLRESAEAIPKHGLVVLVSDLLVQRDGIFQGLNYLKSRGHDVMVLHVMDDDELDFQFGGPTQFDGLELSALVRCDPRMLRKGYMDALEEYLDEVRRICSQTQSDYALFRTSTPLDAALSTFLSRRAKR